MARFFSAGILIVFIYMASTANAAILVSHVGSNNPTSECWTILQSGTAAGSPVVDGSILAWKTLDTQITYSGSPYNDYLHYFWGFNSVGADLSAGWTVTAKVRVINNVRYETNPIGYSAYGAAFVLNYMQYSFAVDLVGNDPDRTTDGAYINPGAYDTGAITFVPMDTTDAYHTYQFISRQNTLDFYVDGLKRGSYFTQDIAPWVIQFGSGNYPDRGEANWALVQVETGVHIVPEPTTLALLAASSVFLRRRK